MKISIITVCFNAKDTIEDTFLSIFAQSYKDFELIVIDGGSVDGTLDIINKHRDKISYFISEPDRGLYDAMNKGIKAASGDFLFFLNANDIFFDSGVLTKVALALTNNPDKKFLFGDVEYISEDKQSSKIVSFRATKTEFSLIYNNICHQGIFYHQSLFEKFGLYSNEYQIYADWDFNIKCLVQNRVSAMYLPIVISKFQMGGACSDAKAIKNCREEKKLLIKKYYPKYIFVFSVIDFLRQNFRKPFNFLIQRKIISKMVALYTMQKKYLLQIETKTS